MARVTDGAKVAGSEGDRHSARVRRAVILFVGLATSCGPKLIDEPLPADAVKLYASNDHMGNFIDGVRTRKRPICDVEVGHRSATVCHIGVISLRLGIPLNWDPKAEQFVGPRAEKGNAMLSREMRSPWRLEV